MLVNFNNCVVLGERFDASLEEIDEFLRGGNDCVTTGT